MASPSASATAADENVKPMFITWVTASQAASVPSSDGKQRRHGGEQQVLE